MKIEVNPEDLLPLINSVKNKAEKETRLAWLSEGSLRYHLLGLPIPAGGCEIEKQTFCTHFNPKNEQ
jgi:hypothetical protein